MTINLLRTTILSGAIAMAGTFAAADPVALSNIEVRTDLTDFENSNALEYWPDLAADLSAAIAERSNLTGDSSDPSVRIEVTEVAVNGATMLPDTGEFNELFGIVIGMPGESALEDGQNNRGVDEPFLESPILLHAKEGTAIAGEGVIMVPPSQDDFYNAMVATFADIVVQKVEETKGEAQ